MRILVIEDEKELAHLIRRGLTEEGYAVDVAYDGEEGESFAESVPYDLIILDIVLPRKDGFLVCSSLRRKGIKTRVLMLTGRDSVADRVKGLDTGADDYLIKPFVFEELTARIRALLRREIASASPAIQVGDITLNAATREVTREDRAIDLNNKEYAILEYLMRNVNMVITRQMIEDHVWNFSLESSSNLVDVYIRRLRSKLDNPGEESLIDTVRGVGYRLRGT
jgi:DNA-binding response OmpR family regulator